MTAGSGPAVAALCRLGDLHAPGEGATDGSLSTVLRNAVGFSFVPTSHASAFLGSLGEGFHGSAETARESGRSTKLRNREGREIDFPFDATQLCVAVPLHRVGYTGSGMAFWFFIKKKIGFPGRDDHQFC